MWVPVRVQFPVVIEQDLWLVGEYLVNSVAIKGKYWPPHRSWLGLQGRPCLPCYVDIQMEFYGV